MDLVDEALTSIQADPAAYGFTPHVPRELGVRRKLIPRFPIPSCSWNFRRKYASLLLPTDGAAQVTGDIGYAEAWMASVSPGTVLREPEM